MESFNQKLVKFFRKISIDNKSSNSKEKKMLWFFSKMVDEGGCSKKEKLLIFMRYAIKFAGKESFMGFTDCSSSRDKSILAAMTSYFLKKRGL